MEKLSTMVKQWRIDRGFSLRQAGERLSVHYDALHRLERGVNPPTLITFCLIAKNMPLSRKQIAELVLDDSNFDIERH